MTEIYPRFENLPLINATILIQKIFHCNIVQFVYNINDLVQIYLFYVIFK